MRASRAFTLIELLIVVAIIAILAAIAVPNFLEAQVRSKVSRQMSNMRVAIVAVEAYRVDHTSYPATTHVATRGNQYMIKRPVNTMFQELSTQWKFYPGYQGYYHGLTTPVAYLAGNSALEDVFRRPHGFSDPLANQVMWLPTHWYIDFPDAFLPQTNRYGDWVMRSAGPDTFYQNKLDSRGDYDAGEWELASYDATNGTVSAGDIYRSQKKPDETHVGRVGG